MRLLPKIDITNEGEGDRIVQVIEDVPRNLAVRVPVESQCGPETPVGKFLASLRGMPNMHFV